MQTARIMFAAAILIAAAGFAHAGGGLASAPLYIDSLEDYHCSVVNTGTKDVSSVTVVVYFAGGNNAVNTTCAPLTTGQVCAANSTAAMAYDRYCKVTVEGSAKALRGTYCNDTDGVCETLR